MLSFESPERLRPPGPAEFEVSLFGPGVGESVVVHLGAGKWMVVDSCLDRSTSRPVALDYIACLGFDPATAVTRVVVTHWHDDHTRGLAEILRNAPAARLCCSAALRTDEFKTVLEASRAAHVAPSGVDGLRMALDVLRERSTLADHKVGPQWVLADMVIYSGPGAVVTALSPSSTTFTMSLHEFSALLPTERQPKRRLVVHTANEVAVALHVQMGPTSAILGADLERGRDGHTGWRGIVSNHNGRDRAGVFKVPHHGSSDAHEDDVWTQLLLPEPCALVTPYAVSGLPRQSDLTRLGQKTPHLHCAASSRGKRSKLPRSIRRLVDRVATDIRDIEGAMGQVRVRAHQSAPDVRVEHFGAAFAVTPAA